MLLSKGMILLICCYADHVTNSFLLAYLPCCHKQRFSKFLQHLVARLRTVSANQTAEICCLIGSQLVALEIART